MVSAIERVMITTKSWEQPEIDACYLPLQIQHQFSSSIQQLTAMRKGLYWNQRQRVQGALIAQTKANDSDDWEISSPLLLLPSWTMGAICKLTTIISGHWNCTTCFMIKWKGGFDRINCSSIERVTWAFCPVEISSKSDYVWLYHLMQKMWYLLLHNCMQNCKTI